MGFGCPICSEKLEKLPGEARNRAGAASSEVNISATPCGHVFHSYCIQKWLSGSMASSKQCPCCRKEVPRLRCLALFPTTYDDSILDDSLSQPTDVPQCNHNEIIGSLKTQITRLQSDLKEKNELYDLMLLDHNDVQEKYRTEKMTSDTWMMRAKQYESYKDLADDLEARAKRTESKLKTYTQLESMIKGVENAVKEDINNIPATKDSIQSLIEMKHVMSAELRKKERIYTELKDNYERIRTEKMKLKGQLDKKVQECKELKHIYEISRVNGRVRSISPLPGPSTAYDNGSTPTGFRNKRRFQEPIVQLGSESKVSSISDMDLDVDIFPTSLKSKKAKQTKTSNVRSKKAETKEKFSCALSPIAPPPELETPKNSQDSTIILDSDSEDDTKDELRIRGNVPGASLPIAPARIKSLQLKSQRPILGISSTKKFTFKKHQ